MPRFAHRPSEGIVMSSLTAEATAAAVVAPTWDAVDWDEFVWDGGFPGDLDPTRHVMPETAEETVPSAGTAVAVDPLGW